MRLYEFEGKQLFEKCKIPVGERHIARSSDEAYKIVNDLKYPVVIKSQVLTGLSK